MRHSTHYRLNHSVFDLPMAVLLHPGLLDDCGSSLFGCLSVEQCWDQYSKYSSSVHIIVFLTAGSPPVVGEGTSLCRSGSDLLILDDALNEVSGSCVSVTT